MQPDEAQAANERASVIFRRILKNNPMAGSTVMDAPLKDVHNSIMRLAESLPLLATEPPIFVDVGAAEYGSGKGHADLSDAREVLKVTKRAQVYALDVQAPKLLELEGRVAAADKPRFRTLNLAVASFVGEVPIYPQYKKEKQNNWGIGKPVNHFAQGELKPLFTVNCTTIAELVGRHIRAPSITMFKIDCEGCEPTVLPPNLHDIAQRMHFVSFEYGQFWNDAWAGRARARCGGPRPRR